MRNNIKILLRSSLLYFSIVILTGIACTHTNKIQTTINPEKDDCNSKKEDAASEPNQSEEDTSEQDKEAILPILANTHEKDAAREPSPSEQDKENIPPILEDSHQDGNGHCNGEGETIKKDAIKKTK